MKRGGIGVSRYASSPWESHREKPHEIGCTLRTALVSGVEVTVGEFGPWVDWRPFDMGLHDFHRLGTAAVARIEAEGWGRGSMDAGGELSAPGAEGATAVWWTLRLMSGAVRLVLALPSEDWDGAWVAARDRGDLAEGEMRDGYALVGWVEGSLIRADMAVGLLARLSVEELLSPFGGEFA